MRAIMTVTGLDHTGIVSEVTTELAKHKVNILNISQNLMGEYFTMILHLEFDETKAPLGVLQTAMEQVAKQEALDIRIQSEAIFAAMHQL
ncbi:hypothetical protein BK816_02260 [Boudabousia tangfeifanii]|uniref:UPF0237 protein BK816_02260 n=1 Tax=Boudabousia tangfeifanii TaxID=1912795 RepID=A0A1D9MIY7_9ACTO|nr:ACT domain-containing protein [Boudabousia tangfeifanii]AOZ72267.1 hypothetical protein BK816_02260 [Boudabousia tangfeifanii]